MIFSKRSNESRESHAARLCESSRQAGSCDGSCSGQSKSSPKRAVRYPMNSPIRNPTFLGRACGIGNVLRHEYDGLSDPIIWRVVTDELPKLKHAIENIRKLTDK